MKLSSIPFLLLLTSACSGVCSDNSENGIGVIVENAIEEDGSCGVVVTIKDGAYTETLPCSESYDNPEDCLCLGAWDRAGTYTVTVTDGDTEESQVARVKKDGCHIEGVGLVF